MNNTIKFSVDRENNGKRLDIFLAKNMSQFTRSFLKKIIENKQVSLNNKILTFPSAKIKFKDLIIVNVIENNDLQILPKRFNYRLRKIHSNIGCLV